MTKLSLDPAGLATLAELIRRRGADLADRSIPCPDIGDADVATALSDVVNIGARQIAVSGAAIAGEAVAARHAVAAYERAEAVIARGAR